MDGTIGDYYQLWMVLCFWQKDGGCGIDSKINCVFIDVRLIDVFNSFWTTIGVYGSEE